MSIALFFANLWASMNFTSLTDQQMTKGKLFDLYENDKIQDGMAEGYLRVDPESHREYVTFDVLKTLSPDAKLDVELDLYELCKAILSLDCFKYEQYIREALRFSDYDDEYDLTVIEANMETKIPAGREAMEQLFDQCLAILKSMNFNANFFSIDKRRSLTKMATKLEIFKDHRPSILNSMRMRIDINKLQTIGKACKRFDSLNMIATHSNEILSEDATSPTGPLWHAEGKHRAGNRCSACDAHCGMAETCERCMQGPETLTLSDSGSETETDDECMPNQEHNELYHRPRKRMRT